MIRLLTKLINRSIKGKVLFCCLLVLIICFNGVDVKASENIFSDDFENDLANWTTNVVSPNQISIDTEQKQSGSKSLKLHLQDTSNYVSIVHNFSSSQNGMVEIWFWDNLDESMGTFAGIKNFDETETVLIGVNTSINSKNYIYRTTNSANGSNFFSTYVPRSKGWHKFEFVSTPKGSYGLIDGNNLAYLAENKAGDSPINIKMVNFQKIIIASTWNQQSDAFYDNLTVTKLDSLPVSVTERQKIFLQNFINKVPNYDEKHDENYWRSFANRAMSLSILNQNRNEIISLIQKVVQDYPLWGKGKTWTSPIPALDVGLASWISWKNLDQNTRNQVENMITQEANYWSYKNPETGYIGDTKAESNAWTAALLSLATNMFPKNTQAEFWDKKARTYAFHTFTINETYDGVTTQTIYPNYLLANHNFYPNPGYAISASIGCLADGALFYIKTGRSVPDEFKHNVLKVWTAHKPYINFSNYHWQNAYKGLGGKDDWYADHTNSDSAIAFIDYLFGTKLTEDLTTYYFYVLPDLKGSYPVKTESLKYLLNSVHSKRQVISLMFFDDGLKLEPIIPIVGDANQDNKVDLLDFSIWKSEFLERTNTKTADFNGDNKIDLVDFSIWKNNYLN